MIFIPKHIELIKSRIKTQTRRIAKNNEWLENGSQAFDSVVMGYDPEFGYDDQFWTYEFSRLKWKINNTYAIQAGRGKSSVGCIKITGIRKEKLQDITEADAQAEGGYTVEEYARKWDEINKRKGTRWQDNPDVWVLEFEFVPVRLSLAQVKERYLPNRQIEGVENDPSLCKICTN